MLRFAFLVPLSGVLALTGGCAKTKIGLGAGGGEDARYIADVYTWDCEDRADTGDVQVYDGVYSYNISLEYAPDKLAKRELPKSGCTKGLDLFPSDAGGGGLDIPESDVPEWSNGDLSGKLDRLSAGFYYKDVSENVSNCSYAEDLLGEGTSLQAAGVFSGAKTPKPGSLANVGISDYDKNVGITTGTSPTISWDASGWADSWIQVRRENTKGDLSESVTCATAGADSYTVGDEVWSLMNAVVEAEVTNLYIVVQNDDTVTTDDGQKMKVLTREVYAAVVH